ncbi:T6SS phospholipase effector Tle1-like catalytic domain-containing protein [Acinetobacter rudis]|uniref:DUF2235 domain-containing protein n=2 Tax=Acinetobacter rudis TaxID=632955 RepID=S3N3B7_9GAMM|nr:DUF2235 domain-containing protein [Acinetobacter rudis]EPF74535.1 hypothetical protein F945_01574 [Acinetobacter rudis CIP 110305]
MMQDKDVTTSSNTNQHSDASKMQSTQNSPVKPINSSADKTNPTENSQSEQKINRLEISVFFDGTWNNRTNSNLYNGAKRYDGDPSSLPRPMDNMNDYKYNPDLLVSDNISYARLPTTVDRMHRAYKDGLPHHYSLYIDGCGTGEAAELGEDRKLYFADNPIGAGLGWGSTGVKAKIKKAFKQLNKMIRDKTKTQTYQVLVINLFGFSRGSATARIFANHILKKQELIDVSEFQRKIVMPSDNPMQIQLKFMGIFDCVSSIGFTHGDDEGLDFADHLYRGNEDDMPPSAMGFNLKQHEVCRIVHLSALNEYRDKFSLYDIRSAVERGFGVEIRIPGCHTDLGDGLGTKGKVDIPKGVDGKPDPSKKTWYVSARDEAKVTIAQKKVAYSSTDPKDADYTQDDNKYRQNTHKTKYDFKNEDILSYDEYNQKKPTVFGSKDSALAQMERVDFEQLKSNLVNKGFFKETFDNSSQIWIEHTEKPIKKFGLFATDSQYQRLIINREQLSMLYPIIPANIMIELCKRYQLDVFEPSKLFEYGVDYAKAKDDVPNGVWGQVYEDLKAQALAWDLELMGRFKQHKQTEVNEQMCKPMDTNGLIKHIEPQDEAVRKKMYNNYIHWSSQLETKGLISQYAQVSLGQINHITHMFERTIYRG